MSPARRKVLLMIMSRLEQVIAALQDIIIAKPNEQKVVRQAKKQLAESQAVLEELERRLAGN